MIRRVISVFLFIIIFFVIVACDVSAQKESDRKVVTLCAPQNSFIEDFDTNAYKLWLEEQTGLIIKMVWLPEKNAEDIIRTALLTGNELPDAYVGISNYSIFNGAGLENLGKSGVIVPLNEMIEEHGANLKSVWSELSDYNIKEYMTSPDGNIYFMPGFSSSIITRYRQIMWLNKGWLDSLGLQIPTTTEEFRSVLYAFLTQDPNKNGINDEIPLAGTEKYMGKQMYDYIFNAFIYNNEKNMRLLLENGNISFAPIRDEWREALKYMNGLYKDGLIYENSFTQDDTQMKQMATDRRDILGGFTSPGITYTVQQNSPEVLSRYVGIAPIKGPNGAQFATVSIPLPKVNGVITSACEYPEEVFALFDFMLSEEACLRGRYGEQGMDWDIPKDGQVSIYGTPATIEIKNQLWNNPQNKHLKQIVPYVSRPEYSGGVTWDGNATDGEYMNAQAAMKYVPFEPQELIGALVYSSAEDEIIQELQPKIEGYTKNAIIDFITGEKDVYDDAEWGAYVDGYAQTGLYEFLKTVQSAYDREIKRDES